MSDEICSICLEFIINKFTTRCRHSFCKECIETWFLINSNCPICRNNLIYYTLLSKKVKGFQYKQFKCKLGLNINTEEFNPSISCESNGIYYTDKENAVNYLECSNMYIAKITIPDDAKICKDIE
mgnify:CR=1 FL=1